MQFWALTAQRHSLCLYISLFHQVAAIVVKLGRHFVIFRAFDLILIVFDHFFF